MEKANIIFNCINCNDSIRMSDETFICKDCNKIGICNICYITGFPYPNICFECRERRRYISNIIKKKKLDIEKNKEKEFNDRLNSNLYGKKNI